LPEKKQSNSQPPPWETANIVFKMQEQARKRKLLEADVKQRRAQGRRVGANTQDELEENKARLKALRERLAQEPVKK
jgi:hypothetical protein